jgi:hypothetical protein
MPPALPDGGMKGIFKYLSILKGNSQTKYDAPTEAYIVALSNYHRKKLALLI